MSMRNWNKMTFTEYAAKSVSDARVLVQTGSIYVLRNTINGKCYVGQTIQRISRRLNAHRLRTQSAISMAINKYGMDSFDKVEHTGIPIELLDHFERELISQLNTISPNGYNLESGGNANKTFSEETKDKMRLAKIGKPQSEESNRKRSLALKGKPLKIEHRNKIAMALIGNKNNVGYICSDETKTKISMAKKGKSHKGHPMSESTRNKIIEANTGIIRSEETRQKLRIFNLGKMASEETKKRMSAARKGKKKTEETKTRMKTAWIKRRLNKRGITE